MRIGSKTSKVFKTLHKHKARALNFYLILIKISIFACFLNICLLKLVLTSNNLGIFDSFLTYLAVPDLSCGMRDL